MSHLARYAARMALLCTIAGLGACAAAPPRTALPPVTPIMIPPPLSATSAPDLTGGTWHWQGANDLPRDAYTLEFAADGRALVRADCNRGSGRYVQAAGERLTLTPIATTKMACPAGSRDAAFLRQLGEVEGYRFEADALILQLRGGATMRLTR